MQKETLPSNRAIHRAFAGAAEEGPHMLTYIASDLCRRRESVHPSLYTKPGIKQIRPKSAQSPPPADM